MQFESRVAQGGERPKCPKRWPPALRNLVQQCWREEPSERPSFGEVATRLESLLRELLLARAARGGGGSARSRSRSSRPTEALVVGVSLGSDGERVVDSGRV